MSNAYGGIGFCKEEAKTFAQLLLHWDHGMNNGRPIPFLWRHKFPLGCDGHVSKFSIQSLYYPLSRQVNMTDSCEWIFRLFGRDHCRSRIFERMEIFKMTAVALGLKKPLKNSCLRQLRIVNAVVSWSPADQMDWPKAVFLQYKVTLFEAMMTTINEINRDKTKVPDWLFFRNVSLVCFTAELDE